MKIAHYEEVITDMRVIACDQDEDGWTALLIPTLHNGTPGRHAITADTLPEILAKLAQIARHTHTCHCPECEETETRTKEPQPMTIVTTAHMHKIDPGVTRRQRIEQRIASRAVSALLAAGYWLAVCQGDEDEQPASRYKRDIMKLLGECDEDRIIVYSPAKGRVGWVHLVYGNDNGETVICDYTTNLEPQLQAVNAYAETLV